ncbi:hypothetical protein EA462_10435 [Natrarchaeobius halalkaliphilus]|uniref:Uncharacterized protein n=1 Tax=Natrarchaeobius halalkaliphilus TaxID=1679091 RepID=A0A3N6LJF7_9EURY|nr:hypothetical protein [Natrarchaeobius halalkaliphilus]RQG88813.1 hypothetical protein EA462_10435 [Natrarchaeobius halalkaliphilus]
MTDQPPSPSSPAWPSAPRPRQTESPDSRSDGRAIVTTAQLAASLENAVGYRIEEGRLDELLLELERQNYVEWAGISRTGDYVWDLTDAPDRIAAAVATAVGSRFRAWLESRCG